MKQNGVPINSIFWLYLLTIVSQLANIVYEAYVNQSAILPLLVPSILFLTVLTLPALLIGFQLGRDLGLAAFDNRYPVNHAEIKRTLVVTLTAAVSLGAVLLLLRWILLPYLPAEMPAYGFRGW